MHLSVSGNLESRVEVLLYSSPMKSYEFYQDHEFLASIMMNNHCPVNTFAKLVQILVKTVPIKQGHKLRIIWPITPSIRNYKEGPCRYLGHLIGHEGEGSLFYVLKTLGNFSSLQLHYWSYLMLFLLFMHPTIVFLSAQCSCYRYIRMPIALHIAMICFV